MNSAKPVFTLRGHEEGISFLQFINAEQIISSDTSGVVKIWSINSKRSVSSFEAHSTSIQSITSIQAANQWISSGRDEMLKLWDISARFQGPIATMTTGCDYFCNAWSNSLNGNPLVVSASGRMSEVLVWDIRSPHSPSMKLQPPVMKETDEFGSRSFGIVTSLTMTSGVEENTSILAGYEDGSVCVYDLKTKRCEKVLKLHAEPIFSITASLDGSIVATGGGDDIIKLTCSANQDFSTVNEVTNSSSRDAKLPAAGTSSMRFRSDGRILVSGHWDNCVRLFDRKKLKTLATLRYHRKTVQAVAFSPAPPDGTGSPFVSGCSDGLIAYWDLFQDSMK